ncbi:MAG: hypothetical protein P9L92_10760 [Candidatus Electryonea clarkiae]|nr:hypothetical protein [Candidatus Electryonea clarkiae]MDP8287115.1 hypothetical protein [Candidatus Electryonea clarkiae]
MFETRKHKIFVIGISLIVLMSSLLHASEPDKIVQDRSKALHFFPIYAPAGASLLISHPIKEKAALRWGFDLMAQKSNYGSERDYFYPESYPFRTTFDDNESEMSNYSIDFVTQLIFSSPLDNGLGWYWGLGPVIGIDLRKTERENFRSREYTDYPDSIRVEYDETDQDLIIFNGGMYILIGFEWKFHPQISLEAEYGVLSRYRLRKDTWLTSKDLYSESMYKYESDIEDSSWSFETGHARIGLAFYFHESKK